MEDKRQKKIDQPLLYVNSHIAERITREKWGNVVFQCGCAGLPCCGGSNLASRSGHINSPTPSPPLSPPPSYGRCSKFDAHAHFRSSFPWKVSVAWRVFLPRGGKKKGNNGPRRRWWRTGSELTELGYGRAASAVAFLSISSELARLSSHKRPGSNESIAATRPSLARRSAAAASRLSFCLLTVTLWGRFPRSHRRSPVESGPLGSDLERVPWAALWRGRRCVFLKWRLNWMGC